MIHTLFSSTNSLVQKLPHVPLLCFPNESFKKRVILSEGMAKEIPAATFRVLIPITSPSL